MVGADVSREVQSIRSASFSCKRGRFPKSGWIESTSAWCQSSSALYRAVASSSSCATLANYNIRYRAGGVAVGVGERWDRSGLGGDAFSHCSSMTDGSVSAGWSSSCAISVIFVAYFSWALLKASAYSALTFKIRVYRMERLPGRNRSAKSRTDIGTFASWVSLEADANRPSSFASFLLTSV